MLNKTMASNDSDFKPVKRKTRELCFRKGTFDVQEVAANKRLVVAMIASGTKLNKRQLCTHTHTNRQVRERDRQTERGDNRWKQELRKVNVDRSSLLKYANHAQQFTQTCILTF